MRCLYTAISKLPEGKIGTVGFIYKNVWRPGKFQSNERSIAFAIEFLVKNVFHATGVVAARYGRAPSRLKMFPGATASKLLWWIGEQIDGVAHADISTNASIATKDYAGEHWNAYNYLQLMLSPGAGVDMSALLDPDLKNYDDSVAGDSNQANTSGRSSAVDPDQLSRIDEEDEDDEPPEWFSKEIWLTCSPDEQKMIKEIEEEASIPEVEHASKGDEIWNMENFTPSDGGQELWKATTIPPTKQHVQEVVAITWPDQDADGNTYVSIQFPGDAAKLIAMDPVKPGEIAELR